MDVGGFHSAGICLLNCKNQNTTELTGDAAVVCGSLVDLLPFFPNLYMCVCVYVYRIDFLSSV